jgi:hypothetical protein
MRLRAIVCFTTLLCSFAIVHASDKTSAEKTVLTGVISDSICARAGSHKEAMQMDKEMGKTAAACTIACVEKNGAKYVLYDAKAKKVYRLSDQAEAKKFAGQSVKVTGTLKKNQVTVESIVAE